VRGRQQTGLRGPRRRLFRPRAHVRADAGHLGGDPRGRVVAAWLDARAANRRATHRQDGPVGHDPPEWLFAGGTMPARDGHDDW